MKLCLGVPSWQDGGYMIERTIESLGGQHDLLLIADGKIDGVRTELPDLSDLSSLNLDGAVVEQRVWESQGAKRDWMLQTARAHGCDWLLQLDTDERLHSPWLLRRWLEGWKAGAFPLPFEMDRVDWPGRMVGASWKLLQVSHWRRIVAQGAFIEHLDGQVYLLVPPEGRLPAAFTDGVPYVSHHPEERPAGRREIRLSKIEDELEPVAGLDVVPYPTPDFHAVPAWNGNDSFYCDQCGQRFSSPGVCDRQHPARLAAPLDGWPPQAAERVLVAA